jgi:type I restriction enzyme R subunit
MGWVRLHPYNIAQKVQMVVEHYRRTWRRCSGAWPRRWWWWQPQGGGALAAGDRKYILERGYKIGTLVAFSGEVNDKDPGPDPFTEQSPKR